MADEPIPTAPFHSTPVEMTKDGIRAAMLERYEELRQIGPLIAVRGFADGRAAFGVTIAGALTTVDLGRLLERTLVDADEAAKTTLLRGLGRALRSHCPEAADYLESYGS